MSAQSNVRRLLGATNERFEALVGEPGPLTGREALTRFVGAGLLLAVGYTHLTDVSHKISEGIWYMVFLFTALIVASIVLAVALVRADDSKVRFVWVGAAGLAIGAMFGYLVSRSIALPGMADHRGDWFSTVGVFAWFFEVVLVGLAAFALRDRVLRRRRKDRPRRQRGRVVAPAMGLLGSLALQPATALAHGGEEMTPEEMAATEASRNSGGVDHAAMGHSTGYDPLLGGTELTILLLVGLGLLAWSGFALFSRVGPAPRSAAARRVARRSPTHPRPVAGGANGRQPSPALATQLAVETRVPARDTPELEPPTVPLATVPGRRRRRPPPEISPA